MTRPAVHKALIPAAGRGTRFLPFTKTVPKELAPLVTIPAIDYVVSEAAANGITELALVVAPGKEAVADYFRPAPALEKALQASGEEAALAAIRRPEELLRVSEVVQDVPAGLGDAVAHGAEFAAGQALVVLLPDDLIDERDPLLADMLAVYAEFGGIVLGLIDVGHSEIGKYGSVRLAADSDPAADVVTITDLVEKPPPGTEPSTLAVIGRYVLPPEIFDALRGTQPGAKGEIQLTDAMRTLTLAGVPVHGVVFRGRRYDAGDRIEYVKAVVQFAARHPVIGADFAAWLREYVAGLG